MPFRCPKRHVRLTNRSNRTCNAQRRPRLNSQRNPPRHNRNDISQPKTIARTKPPRDEPVRQESDDAKHDDVDVRQEETNHVASSNETQSQQDNEDEQHEAEASDEVVISDEAEQQRVTIQQIEVEVAEEASEEGEEQDSTALVDAALDGEESHEQGDNASKIEEAFALDDETSAQAATASNETDGDATNQTAKVATDNKAAASETVRSGDELTEAQRIAQQAEGDDADATSDSDKVAATTITSRKPDRAEVTATETSTESTNHAEKALNAAITAATNDKDGDRDGKSRNQQNNPQTAQAITTANQTDSPLENNGAPSRFAQHLLARTAEPNGRSLNITDADQTRFIDRVARAIQATGDRGGTLRLRLSPPELGSLTLEVKVQGGAVSARVEADTPAARMLLLENLPVLRERLAEQGMRVDQFDVDLTDRHTGGTPEDLQQNDQHQEDRPQAETRQQTAEDSSPQSTNESSTPPSSEQLNIIV